MQGIQRLEIPYLSSEVSAQKSINFTTLLFKKTSYLEISINYSADRMNIILRPHFPLQRFTVSIFSKR